MHIGKVFNLIIAVTVTSCFISRSATTNTQMRTPGMHTTNSCKVDVATQFSFLKLKVTSRRLNISVPVLLALQSLRYVLEHVKVQ